MIHGGNVWQGDAPDRWLDYSANIRPEGAPGWVKSALTGAMSRLSYYPDPSMSRAKQALGEYLGLPEEYVLPTAGGISAIDLAAHLPSDGMIQFSPCFSEYSMLGGNQGKEVRSISLLTGLHALGDPASLAGECLPENSMVWLCNPLNPVGTAFSGDAVMRLLELIEKRHGWLIIDEAFIEYCPSYSSVSLIREHERLLITGSMTKILGIPGVRLGYLCAQPQVLVQLRKYQLTWELSCFAEAVLYALPEHKMDIMADAERNARRREHLRSGLERMGVFVYPSEAAFLLADFARPAAPIAERLREKGILVRQCMNFEGIDDGCHLRLAVKEEASNDRLLAALKEAMI